MPAVGSFAAELKRRRGGSGVPLGVSALRFWNMAAAMQQQPNIQKFFNNPSGGGLAAPQSDFSAHAFKVFRVEYHKSAQAADMDLVRRAGGPEKVLREMWEMLPDHKRKAYEDFAKKMHKDALGPADPKAQAKRLEAEKARAAKEAQREAERQLIWQRRDDEKRRKNEQKQEQERQNLFKNHLHNRKAKVDDLQLLVEHITNDAVGRKALGLSETVAIVPPEASPEPGLPPDVYADAIFVTNALERFRELTGLPPLSLQEIISVLRNSPCEQVEEGGDGSADEDMEEPEDEDDEDKDIVAMRNALHEKLVQVLAQTNLENVEGRRQRMLGVDFSVGTEGVIDAHSWPEVVRRYIDAVADDPEKRDFHAMDSIRRVGDRMSRCSYKSLSLEERAAILSFLCAEILDTAKDALDKSFDTLAELKRQKRAEQAEETRLEKQKEAEEKARIAEQKLKDIEEQKRAFGPWLTAHNEDPEKVPELHPQLWKAFEKEYQAEKAALEAAEADKDSDSDSDDEEPVRTGSADSDTAIVIENEDSLTRGEYLRQLRAKREEMRKAKEQEELAKEQRRARKKAKKDAVRVEKEKKRAAEARAREKEQRYDEQLRTLAPRLSPLGSDRYYNRYWYFSCLADKIFVEHSQLPEGMLPPQIKSFRECDGTPAEKRQAAINDTVEGLHEIRAETLQTILTAMKIEDWKTLPDPSSKPALVKLITQHTQKALCSDSYLSMLVCTYRADQPVGEDMDTSSDGSEEDDSSSHGSAGASPLAHRDKRAKLTPDIDMTSPMARKWEYYDTKEQLDELLAYLAHNGEREGALKKELTTIYDKVVAAMETSAGFSGMRRSYGRRRFAKPKNGMRSATSVLMELLNVFVATTKQNRAELDELKSAVRQAICWQDFIQPSLAVSELLASITQRVMKEEKQSRRYAENSSSGTRWNDWLQEWHSFTSNAQTEAALMFSLYSLRQRAHSTLPDTKRNARSRVSDSPAAKAMMLAEEDSEEDDEDDDGPIDLGAELREAAVSGKLMEMKRLLAQLEDEDDDQTADATDDDGKTALMVTFRHHQPTRALRDAPQCSWSRTLCCTVHAVSSCG